jgi:AraC-like DNA-binding protein/quercetin dioxygenase-like cupin family protein
MTTMRTEERLHFRRPIEGVNLTVVGGGSISILPRHAHAEFQLSVVQGGLAEFHYRGVRQRAPEGSLIFIQSEEVHAGYSVGHEQCVLPSLHLDPALFRVAAGLDDESRQALPFFPDLVVVSPRLREAFLTLYHALQRPASRLEHEGLLLQTLQQFLRQCAVPPTSAVLLSAREDQRVKRVREYLDEHAADNTSLEDLARLANLSVFHLVHVFQKTVGLAPHAYQVQARIKRAKALLAAGSPIGLVSQETGFADQAHFSRHFKRLMGATPGQFLRDSKNVQD